MIEPEEGVCDWYSRITAEGKFSSLQVESFEKLVTQVSDGYLHARYQPEPFYFKNLKEIRENCDEIMKKIKVVAKRKEKVRKKPKVRIEYNFSFFFILKFKAAQQALQFMRTATQSAGKQLSVFRQNSRAEEHQKLL